MYRMVNHLAGKTVVITGASQGLGKQLALQLSAFDTSLALIARTESELSKVRTEISQNGGTAQYFVCDITEFSQVQTTFANIVKEFGIIDILVNGAGIWTTDEFEKRDPMLVEKAFLVNSIGPIYCTKQVLPIMKNKNSGHILNVISKSGLDVPENKDWPTYTATKWAVTGYTKAIQESLRDTKIKVSAFYPAGFESNIFETAGETDAHDQPWMMRTADVANAIVSMLNTPDDLVIKGIEMSNI